MAILWAPPFISTRSASFRRPLGLYFSRYETSDVQLKLVRLEGQLALAAYPPGASTPTYFILIEFDAGRIKLIRDFRYVSYIAAEAAFELVS